MNNKDMVLKEYLSNIGKDLTESEINELTDKFLRASIPSYFKLKELEENYKKTPAYAYNKIQECSNAFQQHVINYHNNNLEHQKLHCSDDCIDKDMSGFNIDEIKIHMKTMMNVITESLLGKKDE